MSDMGGGMAHLALLGSASMMELIVGLKNR